MALSDLIKVTPKGDQTKQSVVDSIINKSVESDIPNVIDNHISTQMNTLFVEEFQRELRKVELWLGNPGTGKTYLAKQVAQRMKDQGVIDDYVVINCHEELTVMSILKTTKTDAEGNWAFILNRVFHMITDKAQKRYLVIFDEFNTLSMSVMKALQPILDDSDGEFDFEEHTYTKNINVQFVLTINHGDIGTSMLPDAIVDRTFKEFFDDVDYDQLSERSGIPTRVIKLIEQVREMFAHLGELPEFHKSVRRLKDIYGLSGKQLKKYIVSELELAHIEWKEAVGASPEFENLIDEFDLIKWKKRRA